MVLMVEAGLTPLKNGVHWGAEQDCGTWQSCAHAYQEGSKTTVSSGFSS